MARTRTRSLQLGRLHPLGTAVALVLLLLLCICSCCCQAVKHTYDVEAKLLHQHWERLSREQCFSFSLDRSIARESFEYPDAVTGERKEAKKGDLVNLHCDGIVCPNPVVPDCYMNEDICAEDEWCQLEDQVRFGPWAMADGETPNLSSAECEFFKEQGYDWIFEQVCRNQTHWGPWVPVRGRCSKFRKEQQSCNAYFAALKPGKHIAGAPAPDASEESSEELLDSEVHALADITEHLPPSSTNKQQGQLQQEQQQQQEQEQKHGSWAGDFLASAHRRHLLTHADIAAAASGGAGAGLFSWSGLSHGQQQQQGGAEERADMSGTWASHSLQGLTPQYVVSEKDGRPPARPLLCSPGLVCTGDVEPMPNTCVKIRPPNTCYQGPWWDSTSWCKVGSKANNHFYAGLPLSELKEAAQALILQLPVEHFTGPLNPTFWHSHEADVARNHIQAILAALWPEQYRPHTSFPLPIPDPRKKGDVFTASWNDTAQKAQAQYRRSNKVWSTIHVLIHNCKDPMTAAQVEASRALAVWLRQHFMCCNCRGMWANYVLNALGLPPPSSSRLDHMRWWWRAHNMVSEHAANSRGGHPWMWPSQTDGEFRKTHKHYGRHIKCQNPWFLPWEFAIVQWKLPGN